MPHDSSSIRYDSNSNACHGVKLRILKIDDPDPSFRLSSFFESMGIATQDVMTLFQAEPPDCVLFALDLTEIYGN